jgi:hypothetical protein
MLVLNITVAIGTLNGILFYAHIVAANSDTYFLPFKLITVFISWLNLDIGFDVCFSASAQPDLRTNSFSSLCDLIVLLSLL